MKPDWWSRALSCFILSHVVESPVLSGMWVVLALISVANHVFKED